MTEHKFTDEEVIRALELHSIEGEPCDLKCPYGNKRYCGSKMAKDALDLINRQRAEIERLKKLSDEGAECPTCHGVGKIGTTNWLTKDLSKKQIAKEKAESVAEFHRELKAEAVKEFAERLKKEAGYFGRAVAVKDIDNLVEELTATKRCPDCKYFAWCECFNGPCDLFEREE